MLGVEKNISYNVFNLTHGYWPEDRKVMVEWFNQYLKAMNTHHPVEDTSFSVPNDEQLMVYAKGKRDSQVVSTEVYCKQRGAALRTRFLNMPSFDVDSKRKALRDILKLNEESVLRKVHEYGNVNGWRRFALETTDNKLIPILLRMPSNNYKEFVIVSDPDGKQKVSPDQIEALTKSGSGVALVDLSGTGEASSNALADQDSIGKLRTTSRSYLWLGKTLLGEWVKELNVVALFLKSKYKAQKISIHGKKEAGLAGLFLCAVEGNIGQVVLQDAPVSYLFDNRKGVEFFSTGVHLPEFLKWGDVSLAAAVSGANITFINPVTMSGQPLTANQAAEYQAEFEKVRNNCKQPGKTRFYAAANPR